MTAEEFMNIDDDSHRHELIKGELLTMPLPKFTHAVVAMNLSIILHGYVKANNLGLLVAETGFKLGSDPDTVLGPDIAFISRDRIGNPADYYYIGAPDLAVEVLSPSDRKGQVERKTALWIELGAKSVWNVNTRNRTVEVIRVGGDRKLFYESDELVDDTVPGFRVKVSEIFA